MVIPLNVGVFLPLTAFLSVCSAVFLKEVFIKERRVHKNTLLLQIPYLQSTRLPGCFQ